MEKIRNGREESDYLKLMLHFIPKNFKSFNLDTSDKTAGLRS